MYLMVWNSFPFNHIQNFVVLTSLAVGSIIPFQCFSSLNCVRLVKFKMWQIFYCILLTVALSFVSPPLKKINTLLIPTSILPSFSFFILWEVPAHGAAGSTVTAGWLCVYVNMNVVKLFSLLSTPQISFPETLKTAYSHSLPQHILIKLLWLDTGRF